MSVENRTKISGTKVVHTDSYSSSVEIIDNGLYLLSRIHHWPSPTIVREAFSGGWKLFLLLSPSSTVGVKSDQLYIFGQTPTAVFLPAFEIIEWHLKPGDLVWQAYVSSEPLNFKAPGAIAFDWDKNFKVNCVQDIDQILEDIKSYKSLSLQSPQCAVASATKAFIDQNFMRPMSTKEIATALSLSYSTMTHYFRRAFSMSPSEYRQQLRITAAGSLLAMKRRSATESCYETGHNDYSSFKQGFKKIFGASPRQFSWLPQPEKNIYPDKMPPEASL